MMTMQQMHGKDVKNSSIKGCHGKDAIPLSIKFKHKKDVMESMGRMSKNQA